MDSTPKPTTPAYIGHYQLLEPIGRGGMGLVFRARDTRLEREVAVKCLRTELFEAHYIERFKREALLLAKLNHPNIVQIYDFIEAPEQLALVMELVDGQNLQTYLREHIVPMSQRLHWLTQIAEGLAIAHDAGIIHRDLKAENILINKRGQAKITDLGIAKSQDFNATLTDHVAGSYCSMSPEQAMGENISFKSDLFSLGILAYQLLCGAHPFGDTGNKLQIMQRIISHPPTPPHQHNPDLPAEFVDLLGQLLSKNPDKRPDNTHWVAAQFKKLSAINVHENIPSDDTQALAIPHTNITYSARTQDHPTFETRFVAVAAPKISLWKKLKDYIAANKIVVSSATVSLLLIAGVIVWQLQPKPPKYVAVIPPKLTAEGMQESQQELVKGAVYDAIQQSVIQLDGYYLIPRDEIADVNGDIETVRKATAADELITTEIQCKVEACTITLSRLVSESAEAQNRFRVEDVKTVDVLIDRYTSVAETIQRNLGSLYSETFVYTAKTVDETQYANFLQTAQTLRSNGASIQLLNNIENLQGSIKKLPTTQTLYREIALDLYHETKDSTILERMTNYLINNSTDNENEEFLNNLYRLQIAKSDFDAAKITINKLGKKRTSHSAISEMEAYMMMAKNDYKSAIEYYKRALDSKYTANNLINLSNAYWYAGQNIPAKKHLTDALKLSPTQYKANSILGLIALIEGNIEQAIIRFETAISQKPDDIGNLSNLGLSYLLINRYTDAESLFTKAHELAPQFNTLLLNKADAENLSGNITQAKVTYLKVINSIKKETLTAENLRSISQAYAHLSLTSEALSALKELEKIDSQNIETIYTAALVHTLTGNTASAIFNIDLALEKGMDKLWFKFTWYNLLCKEKEFQALMQEYGEPERCAPQ